MTPELEEAVADAGEPHAQELLEEAQKFALRLVSRRKRCLPLREAACNERLPIYLTGRGPRQLAMESPGTRHQRLGEVCCEELAQLVLAGLRRADVRH